jgi:hypothetical protein
MHGGSAEPVANSVQSFQFCFILCHARSNPAAIGLMHSPFWSGPVRGPAGDPGLQSTDRWVGAYAAAARSQKFQECLETSVIGEHRRLAPAGRLREKGRPSRVGLERDFLPKVLARRCPARIDGRHGCRTRISSIDELSSAGDWSSMFAAIQVQSIRDHFQKNERSRDTNPD